MSRTSAASIQSGNATVPDTTANRLVRYGRIVRWLLRDSLWRFRGRVALTLATGLAGTFIQIGAIGVALLYASALSSGGAVTIGAWTFEPHTSIPLLIMAGGLVLVLFLISAALLYWSGVESIRLRRRYQDFCAERAFERPLRGPMVWPAMHETDLTDLSLMMRIIRGDAAQIGRVLQLMVGAVVPLITAIAAVVTLFALAWLPTAIILALAIVSGFFLYLANVMASRASRGMERHQLDAGRSARRAISELRDGDLAPRDHLPEITNWLKGGSLVRFLNARDQRMRAIERSKLVSNVFQSVALCVVLVAMGYFILREGSGWERLVVYLVALRYALGSQRAVTTSIASVNRFYPQFQRYHDFLRATEPRSRQRAETSSELLHIEPASDDALSGSRTLDVKPGMELLVLSDTPLNRYTVGNLIHALCSPQSGDAPSVADDAIMSRIHAMLGRTMLITRAALNGKAGRDVQAPDVATEYRVVDEAGWSSASDEIRSRFATKTPEITIAVGSDPAAIERWPDACVAVVQGGALIGAGDHAWAMAHVKEITSLAGFEAGEFPASRDAGDDEAEEDEELLME